MSNSLEFNVKDVLSTVEPARSFEPSEFRYANWNAQNAFNRLQVSRETMKFLKDGINENANDLPIETRKKYDEVFCILKEIEKAEIRTITYGE